MSTNGKPSMDEKEEMHDEEHGRIYEITRKVLLAGIGAVSLAQEEAEKFVNRLVERGELEDVDGRKLIDELRERGRESLERGRQRVRETVAGSTRQDMEETLQKMDIPTRADIKALNAKIAALSRKVDELKKIQGA